MTLTLRLEDGTTVSRNVARLPRNWKSWLLRQLPYGTDTAGAVFSITT